MISKYKSPLGGKLILESYERLLDAWDVEKSETDIATTFGKTHVVAAGSPSNPPLVLFHGVGDDLALMWLYNAKALAERFRIYAVDTMGGPGKSEPNSEYFKSYDQGTWIDELLDALKLQRAYMAGVSNGAYLTVYYAVKRPERVIKCVCMSGMGRGSMLRMLAFVPVALFPSEKNINKLMRKLCGPNSGTLLDNAEIMLHWTYLLKHSNPRAMMSQKMVRFSDEDYKTLQGKALFLVGESDGLLRLPGDLENLERNNLAYKVIKDAGHAVNHQQPERINHEIVQFLLEA